MFENDNKHNLLIHINDLLDQCQGCPYAHVEKPEVDCKGCNIYLDIVGMRQKLEEIEEVNTVMKDESISEYRTKHSAVETMEHFGIDYLRLFKALHSEQEAAPILMNRMNKRGA